MSTLYRHDNPKTGMFYLSWYCAPGCSAHATGHRQHCVSLRTRDRKAAEQLQQHKDDQIAKAKAWTLLGLEADPLQDLSLTAFLMKYLTFQRAAKIKEPRTIETERYTMAHLLAFFGAETLLSGLTADRMRAYHLHMAGKLAEATVVNRRRILHSIFAVAVQWHHARTNAADWLPKTRLAKRAKPVVPRDVLATVLAAADPFWSAVIRFLYLSNCRAEECCQLKRVDVFRQEEYFIFRDPKENQDKEIDLTPDLLECITLAERQALSPYVFTYRGRPLNRNKLYKHLRDLGDTAGVHFHPHLLRHSRVTHLLEDGADVLTVMGLAGHRNLSTTEGYAHRNVAQQRRIRHLTSLESALRQRDNSRTDNGSLDKSAS